ncbi:MAG: N-acetyl-alpha-D-glucosaminyl L-malate synthase BshA [Opitutaceae bacterium]|nr:N-acetyl-alpha-D-glucosaminyl L-malate synthase BshA [Opitutaceae bacterium]
MDSRLRIGISCFPSVGGSGILATSLGIDLARRGHEVHFFSYDRPVRLPNDEPGITFHPVQMHGYGIFNLSDYTLPLAVRMAAVCRSNRLDILHAHYAVPHATAAVLAREFLPDDLKPRVVATLHGTDTLLLGRDPAYKPVIRHALVHSDAITTVSQFLKEETARLIEPGHDISVVPNFFVPGIPARSRMEVRRKLGLKDSEALVIHVSNLRPVKRIDLLLEVASRIRPRESFRLLVVAGGDTKLLLSEVGRLSLQDRVIVLENVTSVEDYFAAADLGLITSEYESFCLSILEGMTFGCPTVSTAAGGIPEVIEDGVTGVLRPFGDAQGLATAVERLIGDPGERRRLGDAAKIRATARFSADQIVTAYLSVYREAMASPIS